MIQFRDTLERPQQRRFIDNFAYTKFNSKEQISHILRSLLGPFFNFNDSGTLPNIVTPGGYGTNRDICFKFTNDLTNKKFELSPGYAILSETLFEFPEKTIIDITDRKWYIDSIDYLGVSNNILQMNRIYVCIVYSPDFALNLNIPNKNKAYIGLVTNHLALYEFAEKVCILGVAWVYTINRKITQFLGTTYSDPVSSPLIRRPYPDTLYNIQL